MNMRRQIFTTLTAIVASTSIAAVAQASGTLIRWHKMGEEEGGTNNSSVSFTLDSPVDGSDFQPLDLSAVNSPTYRTISGRPDGGGGIGIEFNSALSQYLSGEELNWPDRFVAQRRLLGALRFDRHRGSRLPVLGAANFNDHSKPCNGYQSTWRKDQFQWQILDAVREC